MTALDELAAAQRQRPLTPYERGRLRAVAASGAPDERQRAAELAAADAAGRHNQPPADTPFDRGRRRAAAQAGRPVDLSGLAGPRGWGAETPATTDNTNKES